MCSKQHVHSIFCILPPYLLRSIAENGSPQQRAAALRTLSVDTTFRALRSLSRPSTESRKRSLSSLAIEGEKQRTIYTADNARTLPGKIVRSEGDPPTGDAS